MTKQRADIFEDEGPIGSGLDLSTFKPKEGVEPPRPGPEVLAQVADKKFVSRDPASAPKKAPAPVTEKYRYRTGRDKQFNTRAKQETIDTFAQLAREHDTSVAVLIERALAALLKELKAEK